MGTTPGYHDAKNDFSGLFKIGVKPEATINERQRIIYFNTLIISLPIVYLLFVLYGIEGYLKPLNQWYFDQYGFFLFSLVCGCCLLLNHFGISKISKLIFVILWPLIQHIIPIIVQQTPTDYYFAYPMGLIFHSLMIQMIYSSKSSPVRFWLFMGINFCLTLTFLDFLQYYDTEGGSELRQLAGNDFYVLVIIMYWLLFNLVIFYIMRVVEGHIVEIAEGRQLVEDQKVDLQSALEQLQKSKDILVQSEKMASLGIFTAGIAHELNNPMNFIGSGTSILFERLDEIRATLGNRHPELGEKFEEIERARNAINLGVDRSSNIVRSLKNYARQEEELLVKINIIDCIHDALVLIPENLKARVNIQEELPAVLEVLGSYNKMTQVFVNLLQNAIDASQDHQKVIVKARATKTETIIEVEDFGEGIPKKDQKRIFDPFFTTKKVGEGTGLGLYIVHDIIKEHNGTITFSSKSKLGTTFIITLPLHRA